MRVLQAILIVAFFSIAPSPGQAASLQIAPVSLEVPAPGATATISARNEGATPLSIQVRVFRWAQVDGADRLEPATEVVASPPAVSLRANSNYLIRIIRLNKAPVAVEEAYRLMIDELPDPNRQRNGAINLVVRYSVPVFFTAPEAAAPRLSWRVETRGGRVAATARNVGGRRLRVSGLRLRDASGRSVSYGDGLVGYVLANSAMRFVAPPHTPAILAGPATVSATTDFGRINAIAPIQK